MTDNNNEVVAPGSEGAVGGHPPSQQRSWWDVHEFLEAVLNQTNYGPIPAAGTPAWTQLADGDPRKLIAVAIDGEHWTLRVETAQIALSEAARAVAESTNWSTVARRVRAGRGPYIARKAS